MQNPGSDQERSDRKRSDEKPDAATCDASNTWTAGRLAAGIAGVAIVYYLSGQLGRTVAPPPGIATVFWPPSGIALAALLIMGNRVWPGVWLGAFLSNNWAVFHGSDERSALLFLAAGAGIDTGSLLQALLGAMLVRRFSAVRSLFGRFQEALTFVGISLSMCLVGCTFGVVSLWLGGSLPTNAVFGRWWTWWIGDTCGVLVMAPLILTWWRSPWPNWSRARWVEAAAFFVGVILFLTAIFVWWHPPGETRYPVDLLILPVVAWVAYRFTQREVTFLLILVLGIALWGTIHGSGPYHGSTPWSTLPVMQAFIGILSILSITIGAVITERKRAGEALEVSEHWLRESQRISRIGSYVFNVKDGSWTSSEILDEILGIGPGYIHNLDGWGALLHSDDRQRVLDHLLNDVIAHGRECHNEYRIVRPLDGEVRWVLAHGRLTLDIKGAPVNLAGTILDVTERRNMEAQLLQAQKMESIGRLAGGVAHDFNNLLTVINGYGALALGQLPPQHELHRLVREICKAGDRAAELTMQLLAFSRKQVLQPKVLSLNDIVRDSDRMLQRLIGEHIELVCVLDPSLRPVRSDPGQLHQVIVNLAVNARDAMPNGGKLFIETANSSLAPPYAGSQASLHADQFVCLTVRDTGRGMDEATMEHVFEPFFTTKGVGEGTGLGLATVYGIVQQSAGYISVHSELGRGATFTVRLPAAEECYTPEVFPDPVDKGSETVLLVEDEEDVRRLLATILQRDGYRVLQASGGEEAIRKCFEYRDPIDLLITDVVMPHMRGPELAACLRAQHASMRVLFISGYTDSAITNQVGLGEWSHYLQKPFAKDALVRAVRKALELR